VFYRTAKVEDKIIIVNIFFQKEKTITML